MSTGYLTMAFDITKPDEVKPVGTFSSPSNGKTLNCFGLPMVNKDKLKTYLKKT